MIINGTLLYDIGFGCDPPGIGPKRWYMYQSKIIWCYVSVSCCLALAKICVSGLIHFNVYDIYRILHSTFDIGPGIGWKICIQAYVSFWPKYEYQGWYTTRHMIYKYIYISIIITVTWSEVPDHIKLTGMVHQIKWDAECRVWSSDPRLSTRRDPALRIKLLLQ